MNNWTATDFLTYLYQLVADSDFETENKEIEIVKTRLAAFLKSHLGIDNYSYSDSLQKIQQTEGVSILNCKEVISSLMPRFEFLKDAKREIFRDLEEIIRSNNVVTPSEMDLLKYIKYTFLTVEMPLSW